MSVSNVCSAAKNCIVDSYVATKNNFKETVAEISHECLPSSTENLCSANSLRKIGSNIQGVFHVPYSPAFTRPGWLLTKIFGPYDTKYYEGMYGDVFAGFTVGMTLIPQALSYASLAGLPPINGLYAAILPSVVYIFLGSGMQLAVGPVALVSLLMGQLISKYDIDYTTDPVLAVNFAAEASFCSGLLMFCMGIFNLGNLIRFISYPVLAGFTTASAMIIGLNQIKNGFGFPKSANVPQVGGSVEYNYEVMKWYQENWDGRTTDGYLWRNVHATNITFGIYVPLMILSIFKTNYKFSEATKKTLPYQIFNFIAAMATLISLIISAHEAYLILKDNDTYHAQNLKTVGEVPAGLGIFRIPTFEFPLGEVFVDVIPLTIIAYMEGYAVARKTSAARGQLSILNASQELLALGLGNLANSVSSGYPVSGSFSRSSLYNNCGAVTPMAKTVTLIVILVALGTLTEAFFFIPQAALSAVVMVAVFNLIDFHEFWVAWKLSKKDFFVMFSTFVFTFIFDTQIGLGIGVGVSLIMLLKDLAYSLESKPISKSFNFRGVDIIRLNSSLIFVSAATVKDTLIDEIFAKNKDLKAVVLDFVDVKHADLSGLFSMKEVMDYARKEKIAVFLSNVTPNMQELLTRAEITGTDLATVSEEVRGAVEAALAVAGHVSADSLDEESLGMVSELLRETKSSSLMELATWSAVKERDTHTNTHSTNKGVEIELAEIQPLIGTETYSVVPQDDHTAQGQNESNSEPGNVPYK